MALIKAGRIVPDLWRQVADDEALPDDGAPALITLTRWRREGGALMRHNGPLGIVLKADEPPTLIADALERFDLVALEFPRFTDGRAYSYARLLRTRFRFTGEIRAVGDVLRDQIPFMLRCGFDGFEVNDADAAEAWKGTGEISVCYQTAADGRIPAALLRHAAPPVHPPRPGPAAAAEAASSPCCAGNWAY